MKKTSLLILIATLAALSACSTETLPGGQTAHVYTGPSLSVTAGFMGATVGASVGTTPPTVTGTLGAKS